MAEVERATGAGDGSSSSNPREPPPWRLCEICRLGDVQGVTDLLPQFGSLLDAHDANGDTPLCIASSRGHEGIVKLLLAHGASVDVAAADGDTPLIRAARHAHLAIVKTLLDCHASPNAANGNGESAVIAAGSSGHFDVVELLISVGASVDGRASNGETLLLAAARWRSMETLLLIVKHAQMKAPGGVHSLVLASLQTLGQYGQMNVEFSKFWSGVIGHLFGFFDGVQDAGLSGDVTFRSMRIMGALAKLNAKSESRRLLHRLAGCRIVFKTIRDIHTEIDELIRSVNATAVNPSHQNGSENWHAMLEQDEREVLKRFGTTIHDDTQLQRHLTSEDDQAEAIALLQYEISIHGDQCSPKLLELLKFALDRVLRLTGTEAAALPAWFLSTRELEFVQPEAEMELDLTTGGLRRGKWLSSDVTIFQSPMAQEQFKTAIDRWFPLSHPNVASLFGASHLRQPHVAVFEDISSSSLRDYLRVEENRHLVWQKLYEIALGLRYLHERGVVLGSLWWDSLWIGADGLAKISGLGVDLAVADSQAPGEEVLRWKSPEVLRGEAPSAASDVFSFGTCIMEAACDEEAPSRCERSTEREAAVVVAETEVIPRPAGLTSLQWQLIEGMCSPDPSTRVNMVFVTEHLRKIAEEHRINFASRVPGTEHAAVDLREFIFPEFGSTIDAFLSKLERRCDDYPDFQDHSSHIFSRLRDVFGRLVDAEASPHDVAVERYIEVLQSRNLYLRVAITEESVQRIIRRQQVAVRNDLLHRMIDEVLSLLPPTTLEADSVHHWEPYKVEFDEPSVDDTESEVDDEPVKIVHFSPESGNPKFKSIHVRGPDSVSKENRPTEWRIPIEELQYKRDNHAGSGAFADVFRGTWFEAPVVIKQMGYEEVCSSYDQKLFSHELRVWKPLNHPHVARLYGACHLGKLLFVCEDATNGTLVEYLRHSDNKSKVWQKLYEASLGLQYLHEQNIVHNDLKCDNLLVGLDGKTKVADFGLSCIQNSAEVLVGLKNQGAWWWRSPEYLRGERVTPASDIYSFSMCILEAVVGEVPRRNQPGAAAARLIKSGRLPERPDLMSDSQWSMIEMTCRLNPVERLQISSMVERLRDISLEQPTPQPVPSAQDDRSAKFSADYETASTCLGPVSWETQLQGSDAQEFRPLWKSVYDRLESVKSRSSSDQQSIAAISRKEKLLVEAYKRLAESCDSRQLLHHVAGCRTVFKTIRDIHTEIDELIRSVNATAVNPSHQNGSENWHAMLEQDEREVLKRFGTTIHDDAQLQRHLTSEDDQAEAIALLQYEISIHGDQCSPKLLELLKFALDRVLRLTGTEAAALPAWFLSTRELEFVQPEAEMELDLTTGGLRRGKWLSSDVTIFQSPMAQEQFKTAIDRWFPLSHPNVASMFGASHLRQPHVAVFEDISSSSLRDYLRVEENRHLVWQKLYEIALGLRYLHERGVVLGSLWWDSLWIGADGLAKISGLGVDLAVADSQAPGEEVLRWKSPEVLRGEAPSAASDVFSFGTCIMEAVCDEEVLLNRESPTLEPPIDASSLLDISSPSPCQLIASMCSFDPLKRPTVLAVAGHLKKFADDCIRESANARAAHLEDEQLIASLWEHKFPDLASLAIAEYLELLKGKCAFCNDFKELISRVFARLADISSHFHKMEMPPECVAVEKFVRVLRHAAMVLNFSVGMNTSAVRARNAMSQRVSMTHHLLHKQIDEVLEFIPAANVNDEVHNWSGTPKSGKRVTYRENGITLTEYVSAGVSQRLKTFGDDAVASKHPRFIPLHEVDFDEEDIIADGGFARIYKGEWLRTRVVIKVLYGDDRDRGSSELFFHELRIWSSLNHPHILKLLGACRRDARYFVCEYAPNGTLTGFLKRYGHPNKTWQKLYEVALGLQYLHGMNIVHNDLKCDQFLIGDDGKAKITDFGLSSILNSAELQIDPKSQGGVLWKSPEYLRGERPTLASDVYSFGMCILEAVIGKPPWGRILDAAVRFQVLRKGNLPLRPDAMSDSQWDLFEMMCASEPSARLSISSVVDRLYDFAQEERIASTSSQ